MRFSDSLCGISQKLLKYKKTSSCCGLPPVLPTGKSKQQLPVCCLALSLEGSHCSEEIHKPGPDNAEPQTSPWKKWAVKVKDSLLLPQAPRHSTWPITSPPSSVKRHCWELSCCAGSLFLPGPQRTGAEKGACDTSQLSFLPKYTPHTCTCSFTT